MFHGSNIELRRSALQKNLKLIRGLLGENTMLSAVIKGNAYGHGICEMATVLQEEGVTYFSVFNAEEAYTVHNFLRETDTLMIMGDVDGDALTWAIEKGVEFFVFDLNRLNHSLQHAMRVGVPARVHLEVETGMNRTGLNSKELKQALQLLQRNPDHLEFAGLCTHFAGAESITNYHRVKSQIRKFRTAAALCDRMAIRPERLHSCCSAGLLRYPRMKGDLVRVGILMYGHWPNRETMIEFMTRKKIVEDPLERVLSWKSRVMTLKSVKKGQFVGYGTSFQAADEMQIAVVPVGYGYGYARSLSNQGYALIRGHRAPVIGTINMNALSLDVSDIGNVSPGDEVVLIGFQGEEEVTVNSFSEMSHQLNYEMLSRLPASIPRQILN